MSLLSWRRRESGAAAPSEGPRTAPPPPIQFFPDYQCPTCKSIYCVPMMPIKTHAASSDGGIREHVVGTSVACFECGTVYGVVGGGVGVVTRKAGQAPSPAATTPPPHAHTLDGSAKSPAAVLERAMEGMKWKRPNPRTP